jgi:hypothetical protein
VITKEAGGYRLTQRTEAAVFNDLELYLMGLIPAGQVADQYVFRDQNAVPPCDGRLFTGTMDTLRVSDITGALGNRVPDTAQSKKTFRLATIVLSRDSLLSPEAMALYSYFARRMEGQVAAPFHQGLSKGTAKPFAITARGLGTMVARVYGCAGLHSQLAGDYQSAIRPRIRRVKLLHGGSYLEITGSNLAGNSREWLPSDFNGITLRQLWTG